MEIRYLRVEEFEKLLALLNTVFTQHNGKVTDFAVSFPRLFGSPNKETTDSHLGAFIDGKLVGTAAMYPLDYVVAGVHIKLIANGNIAVDVNYRGQGIMSAMLKQINAECDHRGDICYLHGDQVRYGRFGYVKMGREYRLTFQPEISPIFTFEPMQIAQTDPLLSICRGKSDYIERTPASFIPALCSKKRAAMSVFDDKHRLVGYLSASESGAIIEEFGLLPGFETDVFRAFACKCQKAVTVKLSAYDTQVLARCKKLAKVDTVSPALFRVINPQKLQEAARCAGVDDSTVYAPYLT